MITEMAGIEFKREPVDDVRLFSVTAPNLEVDIDDDEGEECDEPFLKRMKREPVDEVVDGMDRSDNEVGFFRRVD